jgi:hypothetical protein
MKYQKAPLPSEISKARRVRTPGGRSISTLTISSSLRRTHGMG